MPSLLDATPSAENTPISAIIAMDNRTKVPGIGALITPAQKATLAHVVTALTCSTARDHVQHIFPLFDTNATKPTLAGFMTKNDGAIEALKQDGIEPDELTDSGEYRYSLHHLQTLAKKGLDIDRAAPPLHS